MRIAVSLLLFAVVYLVMAYGCGDRMLALSVAMKSKEFREKDDYRIWQRALVSSELRSAVEPLFKRRARRALPLARKDGLRDAQRFLWPPAVSGAFDNERIVISSDRVQSGRKCKKPSKRPPSSSAGLNSVEKLPCKPDLARVSPG
eukprot:s6_g20.t1